MNMIYKINLVIGIFLLIGFILMCILYPVDWSKSFGSMSDIEFNRTIITDMFLFISITMIVTSLLSIKTVKEG